MHQSYTNFDQERIFLDSILSNSSDQSIPYSHRGTTEQLLETVWRRAESLRSPSTTAELKQRIEHQRQQLYEIVSNLPPQIKTHAHNIADLFEKQANAEAIITSSRLSTIIIDSIYKCCEKVAAISVLAVGLVIILPIKLLTLPLTYLYHRSNKFCPDSKINGTYQRTWGDRAGILNSTINFISGGLKLIRCGLLILSHCSVISLLILAAPLEAILKKERKNKIKFSELTTIRISFNKSKNNQSYLDLIDNIIEYDTTIAARTIYGSLQQILLSVTAPPSIFIGAILTFGEGIQRHLQARENHKQQADHLISYEEYSEKSELLNRGLSI